jgi:hypothetical protein
MRLIHPVGGTAPRDFHRPATGGTAEARRVCTPGPSFVHRATGIRPGGFCLDRGLPDHPSSPEMESTARSSWPAGAASSLSRGMRSSSTAAGHGRDAVRIAIMGSGFGGLGTAIRPKRRGMDDIVVLERAGDAGGTWRDNTYPGCACDVQSHLYSFSFAPNPAAAGNGGALPLAVCIRIFSKTGTPPQRAESCRRVTRRASVAGRRRAVPADTTHLGAARRILPAKPWERISVQQLARGEAGKILSAQVIMHLTVPRGAPSG